MSELSFRLSREGDVPELARLWREVFGDDEDFISEFFRLLWRPEYCRVAEAEGKLAAMGFCLPGLLQTASLRIYLCHGHGGALSRALRGAEVGLEAHTRRF